MSKLYLNVIWRLVGRLYSSKIKDVVNEMRVLNNQKNDPDVNGKPQTKPSAHQARTSSLVRRNLKYGEELKNHCQKERRRRLTYTRQRKIYFVQQDSRLFSFLQYYFSSFSYLTTIRLCSSFWISGAGSDWAIAHFCGITNRCVFWSERVSANLMFC